MARIMCNYRSVPHGTTTFRRPGAFDAHLINVPCHPAVNTLYRNSYHIIYYKTQTAMSRLSQKLFSLLIYTYNYEVK